MDDSELDTLLRASAPAVPAVSDLPAHNERILREVGRGWRRGRAWIAAAATLTIVLGGGSMALAGDGYPTPWGWIADNIFSFEQADGSICFQGMRIDFRDLDQDTPIVQDAQEILRNIDVGALDTTQTEKDLVWEATRSKDPLTPDELRQSAVGTMVAQMLFEELSAKGYDLNPSPIAMHTNTTDCAQ